MPVDPIGIGAMAPLPTASAIGTPLALPAGTTGVQFYLPTGASVTYTVAHDQPSTAPTAVFTMSTTVPTSFQEQLARGQQVFITAFTGSVVYRAL